MPCQTYYDKSSFSTESVQIKPTVLQQVLLCTELMSTLLEKEKF